MWTLKQLQLYKHTYTYMHIYTYTCTSPLINKWGRINRITIWAGSADRLLGRQQACNRARMPKQLNGVVMIKKYVGWRASSKLSTTPFVVFRILTPIHLKRLAAVPVRAYS